MVPPSLEDRGSETMTTATTSSSPPPPNVSSLLKDESSFHGDNDDGHGSAAMTTEVKAASPPPPSDIGTTTDTSAVVQDGDDGSEEVDPALLSALSDRRERINLLRLERTLLEFMKNVTAGYIEVGGPGNSVVVGGLSGRGGAQVPSGVGEGGAVSSSSLSSPVAVVSGGSSSSSGQQGDQRGARQTSFQRLCLHRLADRFNIVRESAGNGIEAGAVGAGGTTTSTITSIEGTPCVSTPANTSGNRGYPPGLIRLVKTKESRIPKTLLIDVDLPADVNGLASNRNYSRAAGIPRGTSDASHGSGKGITDGLASVSLNDNNESGVSGGSAGTPQLPRQRSRKMTIMKRNSSSSGSLKSLTGDAAGKKSKNGRKGRRVLTDKEKAYAEARARIFNESNAAAAAAGDQHSNDTGNSTSSSASSKPVVSDTLPSVPLSSPGSSDEEALPIRHNTSSQDPPSSSKDNNDGTSNNRRHRSDKSGVSKVTWRNRRQEESDPDFQRMGSVRVAGMPPVGVVTPLHAGAVAFIPMTPPVGIPLAGVDQQQQQQHLVSAAPVANTPQHHLDAYGSSTLQKQIVLPAMNAGKKNHFHHHHHQQGYYDTAGPAPSAPVSSPSAYPGHPNQDHRQMSHAPSTYSFQRHDGAPVYYVQQQQQQQQQHHQNQDNHFPTQQRRRSPAGCTLPQYSGAGVGARFGSPSGEAGYEGGKRRESESNGGDDSDGGGVPVYSMEDFPSLTR